MDSNVRQPCFNLSALVAYTLLVQQFKTSMCACRHCTCTQPFVIDWMIDSTCRPVGAPMLPCTPSPAHDQPGRQRSRAAACSTTSLPVAMLGRSKHALPTLMPYTCISCACKGVIKGPARIYIARNLPSWLARNTSLSTKYRYPRISKSCNTCT